MTDSDLIDFDTLNDLRTALGDGVSELFKEFISDGPAAIHRIDIAVQEMDIPEISKAAHYLKGSAGNIGAIALSDACRKLENLIENNETGKILEQRDEIKKVYSATVTFMERQGKIINFNEYANHKRLILIIDDDNITRLTLTKVLEKSGNYKVIDAENGAEGLELFKQYHPDMVLLDVVMPDMDGYKTCQEIRKISDADATPILMLTGLNDVDSIEHAFNAGATDFITKPINWPLLSQRVRYAMRASKLYIDLKKKQTQLEHAQRIARLGYFEYNLDNQIVSCSQELLSLLNIDSFNQNIPFPEFENIIPENDRYRFLGTLKQAISTNSAYDIDHHININSDEPCIVHHHGEPIVNNIGEVIAIAGTIQDITERKKAEDLIEFQTYYDQITELPNRLSMTEKLDELMENAEKNNKLLAVILFHLDRFREINDTLGHRVGDQLLRTIARQFNSYFRGEATLARFDGATFALISEDIKSVDETAIIAQQILDMLSQPYVVHEHEVFISGSVGITMHPMEAKDKETLLKNADTAMSRARKNGGNQYQFFSSEMNIAAQQRLQIETDLRKALEREEFVVYYQPQIDTQTRRVIGMEALIRWNHPEKGIILPFDFIPIAEETGLIIPIGNWVMQTAITQTKAWHDMGYRIRIGVNLSAHQFNDTNLIGNIVEALENTGLEPRYLELEVTESVAMYDFNATLDIIQEIRTMGVHTSIDDFGTGHSSLSYLQRLPVNTVKIDRSFIKDIGQSDDGTLAKTIIAMAHSLGLNVVAEGIESEQHYEFLKQHNCDELQGYLFSHPLPVKAFQTYLQETSAA
ncbi:MAG: EAL domain-containing protein [Gammaproteobacteria bacterium]|jgi:diguanylate cyclase (GGDEF)-like protein